MAPRKSSVAEAEAPQEETPATEPEAQEPETPPEAAEVPSVADADHGEIGEAIYQAVNNMVDNQGLKRQQAFDQLANETGKKSGTIAANYYRIARNKGDRAPRGTRRTSTSSPAGNLIVMIDRVIDDLKDIQKQIESQSEKDTKLREIERILQS